MKVLVVGATGATGSLLVKLLLEQKINVIAIVRNTGKLSEYMDNNLLEIVSGSILDLSEDEISGYVAGCDAVLSCLGHNLTWKGIYGKPRKLVTDTAKLLCKAVINSNPRRPVKYILMNTAGNSNRDLNEKISFGERLITGLIRRLIPPHLDNENAADYLRVEIGKSNKSIEWVAVRPDTLIDNEIVTNYSIHPSPVRSAVFNPGTTSRINVGHFMAQLVKDDELWIKWKGQMPVIYNEPDK